MSLISTQYKIEFLFSLNQYEKITENIKNIVNFIGMIKKQIRFTIISLIHDTHKITQEKKVNRLWHQNL